MEHLISNLNELCFTSDDHYTMDCNSTNSGSSEDIKTIIVTNIDSKVFTEQALKEEFEAIFRQYDPKIIFRYLRSFRRVRLDFDDPKAAELALRFCGEYNFGSSTFKCYAAQIVKSKNPSSVHLLPPKPERQYLISPPASPPLDWEPVLENSPCIDINLLSAIANLAPGKAHELHPASDSQPGIIVEVCDFSSPSIHTEDMDGDDYELDRHTKIPIARTPRPV